MRLVYLSCALVLASCGDDDCCLVNGDAGADGGTFEVARAPVVVNRDLDVLFVIDDSPGMLDKQTNLKNNFPNLINVLNGIEGGFPNVHLGVVTSDLGTKGAEDAVAGPGIGSGPGACVGIGKGGTLQSNTTLVSGTFISDIKNTDGTRTLNYTGSLASAFAALASVGASGCEFEQSLQAAKIALNNNPANAGFLRANAHLAIVLLTDEDDCSMAHSTLLSSDTVTLGPLQSFRCTRFGITCDSGGKTPDEMNAVGMKSQCHSNETSVYLTQTNGYVQFFQGLKADPKEVMVSALVGAASPVAVELRTPPGGGTAIPALAHSCTYTGAANDEVADPAVRVRQFATQFARHGVYDVCQQDLSSPLVQLALQLRLFVGDACLSADPAGLTGCIVRQDASGTSTQLPMCNGGASSTNKPCYELVSDPATCAVPPNAKLVVQRIEAPPPDVVVTMTCKAR